MSLRNKYLFEALPQYPSFPLFSNVLISYFIQKPIQNVFGKDLYVMVLKIVKMKLMKVPSLDVIIPHLISVQMINSYVLKMVHVLIHQRDVMVI